MCLQQPVKEVDASLSTLLSLLAEILREFHFNVVDEDTLRQHK